MRKIIERLRRMFVRKCQEGDAMDKPTVPSCPYPNPEECIRYTERQRELLEKEMAQARVYRVEQEMSVLRREHR